MFVLLLLGQSGQRRIPKSKTMEEKEIREIRLSADGKPLGSVRKVYSTTATFEGDTSVLSKLWQEGEAQRKKVEAQWMALPEEERLTCCQCAAYIGTVLDHAGAHMLALPLEHSGTGKKYTITIKIEENAD